MSEKEESQDQQPAPIKEEVTVDVERSCDNCGVEKRGGTCSTPPKNCSYWKPQDSTVDGEKASSLIGRAKEADAEEKVEYPPVDGKDCPKCDQYMIVDASNTKKLYCPTCLYEEMRTEKKED